VGGLRMVMVLEDLGIVTHASGHEQGATAKAKHAPAPQMGSMVADQRDQINGGGTTSKTATTATTTPSTPVKPTAVTMRNPAGGDVRWHETETETQTVAAAAAMAPIPGPGPEGGSGVITAGSPGYVEGQHVGGHATATTGVKVPGPGLSKVGFGSGSGSAGMEKEVRQRLERVVAYELDQWRQAEQARFLASLKERENERMTAMEQEWRAQDKMREGEGEKFRTQQRVLELRARELLVAVEERERRVIAAEDAVGRRRAEMERAHATRLQEAEAAVRRLQVEFEHQVRCVYTWIILTLPYTYLAIPEVTHPTVTSSHSPRLPLPHFSPEPMSHYSIKSEHIIL
jgi:centrosomal protein CEP120